MNSNRYFGSVVALVVVFIFSVPDFLKADSLPVPRGTPGDLWADVVLGQPDYGIPNSGFGDIQFNQATATSAFHLGGTVVDRPNGVLYVWDSGNNRILGFSIANFSSDPGSNQQPTPFLVLGQPDFFHTGCDHDSNWQNYPTPPSASANCLCGTSYANQSLAEAGSKANMDVDAQGNLYVPDYFNNRILRYNAQGGGPVNNLEPATYEWGQPDFTGWAVNNSGGNTSGTPNNHSLYLSPVPPGGGVANFPLPTNTAEAGVAVDSWGNLWVADDWNHRVLRFPSPGGTCCAAPSPNADLVLGQTGFTTNSTTYLSQPVAVRVDKAGNVYVVALLSFPNSFAVFIYKPTTPGNGTTPPIYGGGSGFVTSAAMTMTSASSAFSSGVEWDAEAPNGIGGAPGLGQSGGLWVARDQEIDLLNVGIDASDAITWNAVKVLMNDTPNDTGGSPAGDNNFTFANAGGDGAGSTKLRQPAIESPGVDKNGNVYWIDPSNNECNGIFRFPAPIPTPQNGIVRSADVEILKPFLEGLEDVPGYQGMHYASSIALASFNGVTQIVQSSDLIRFWNMPSTGPSGLQNGQVVGGLIGEPNSSEPLIGPSGWSYGYTRADRVGHLWVIANNSTSVWVYNLPLAGGENPFLQLDLTQPIPLVDGSGSVNLTSKPGFGPVIYGLDVDPNGGFLWFSDHVGNRVMRIRNPLTTPKVDIVLGQTNASNTGCNGSGTLNGDYTSGSCSQPPTDSTFFNPSAVVLDHHGNLFVSDHGLEDVGNNRMLRFNAATIQNSSTSPLFGVAASAVYGTNGSFTSTGCQTPGDVCGPWQPAFNHDDSFMVVGSDAQVGGNTPFQIVLANPLLGDMPTGRLNDFDPQSFSTAFDDNDNLYVANNNRSRVLVYLQPFPTPTPLPGFCNSLSWGTQGSGNGQFSGVAGVAVDKTTGYVYATDFSNNRVQVFNNAGSYLTQWGSTGTGNGQFKSPNGICVANGKVYVAETSGNRVQVFSTCTTGSKGNTIPGVFLSKFGSAGSGNGQFNGPNGICTDPLGNIYVADGSNFRVQKFKSTGAWVWTVGTTGTTGNGNTQFAWPNSVAVDPEGQFLYVADAETSPLFNDRIMKFDLNGNFISKWGSQGSGNGQFNSPRGVAVDCQGRVYVSEFSGNRAQVFDANGGYLTQFSTQLSSPQGIAVDPAADVYVGDWNTPIVKYTLCAGAISCLPTPTPPPPGPVAMPLKTETDSEGSVIGSKGTPTATPTPDLTPTPNTPSNVVAAPNVSHGEPIKFYVPLDKPAEIRLSLFTVSGEGVYQTSLEGNMGLNTLTWPLKNQEGASVASGLYVYTLSIDDGVSARTQRGKVAVIH